MSFRQKLLICCLGTFSKEHGTLDLIFIKWVKGQLIINLLHYSFAAQVIRKHIFYFMDDFAVIALLILNSNKLLLLSAFPIHLWRDTLYPTTLCSLGLKKIQV